MTVLSSDALLGLSKKEKNSSKRVRLLAISLYLDCHNRAQVARQLKVARRSVNNWVSEYLAHGLAGLEDNQKVTYELEEGRDGRQMAGDLKAV